MPLIEVSDNELARLKAHAEPFVDTPSTVIARLLDLAEGATPASSQGLGEEIGQGCIIYQTEKLPPLVHSKLVYGRFAGNFPEKCSWDSLVRLALTITYSEVQDFEKLQRASAANITKSKKMNEGYKWIDSMKFSYQGVSATDAAAIIVRCAKFLHCDLRMEFVWREKEAAFMPGQRGLVEIKT